MASAIMHLCIAKEANKILNVNEKEFLLGAIAPDISKQVGDTKEKSHFLDMPTYGKDIPNLQKFLDKYKETLKDNAFNLGYYCHLYADMIWFGIFIGEYISYDQTELMYANGETKTFDIDTIVKLLYNDYTNLNVKLIDLYDLDLSLFYEEMPEIKSNIDEIPLDKLQVIVDKMGIIIEQSHERANIIFEDSNVRKFIDKTTNDFIEDLKTIGVI